MKLNELSTRKKLMWGGIIILALMLGVATMSYLNRNALARMNERVQASAKVSQQITELKVDLNRNWGLVLEMMMVRNTAELEKLKAEIDSSDTYFNKNLSSIEQYYQLDQNQIDKINSLKKEFDKFRTKRQNQIGLIAKGKMEEARTVSDEQIRPLYESILSILDNQSKREYVIVDQLRRQDEDEALSSLIMVLSVGFAFMFVSFFMARLIVKMFRRINHEINDGITILSSSASEILSTATEVSTGATETATAMAETTTTVEEVRQTALLTNQKANNVVGPVQLM